MKIEWNKVTWYSKLCAVVVFLLTLLLGSYIGAQYGELEAEQSQQAEQNQQISNPPAPPSVGLVYTNRDYGFSLGLPESWKGYTVIVAPFKSFDGGTTFGQTVTLRNPNWTAAAPTMDIPIQIFTVAQWQKWVATNFDGYPTAAPIGPSERGSNAEYVFATAPRYNYSFLPGWQEVESIIKNIKTF
jgi:hypothetical protein